MGEMLFPGKKKFQLDVEYATKVKFWLDFKIVLLTVKKVLRSADIQSDKNVTMPKFTGNDTIRS